MGRPSTLPSKDDAVPRKPNYQFERQERDRAKAAKKAEKAAARQRNGADASPGEDPAGSSLAKD